MQANVSSHEHVVQAASCCVPRKTDVTMLKTHQQQNVRMGFFCMFFNLSILFLSRKKKPIK